MAGILIKPEEFIWGDALGNTVSFFGQECVNCRKQAYGNRHETWYVEPFVVDDESKNYVFVLVCGDCYPEVREKSGVLCKGNGIVIKGDACD